MLCFHWSKNEKKDKKISGYYCRMLLAGCVSSGIPSFPWYAGRITAGQFRESSEVTVVVWTSVRFLCLIVFVSVLATNNDDECCFQLLSFVWDTYIPTPQGTDFFNPYVMQILKQKYIFKDLFITHHLGNLQRFVKKPLKLPEYQIPNSEKKGYLKSFVYVQLAS